MRNLISQTKTARTRARIWSIAVLIVTLALPAVAHPTRRRSSAQGARTDSAAADDTAAGSQRARRVADKTKKREVRRKVRNKGARAAGKKRSRRAQKRRAVRRPTQRRPAVRAPRDASLPAPHDATTALLDESVAPHRFAVVKTALALEGAPYAYASKGPTRFDCSGFTHFVLKQHGVSVTGGSRHQAQQGRAVDWRSAQPGDLVFFRREGQIRHVGLVVKNDAGALWVAHATNRGVVVDDVLASSYWRPQLSAARTVL